MNWLRFLLLRIFRPKPISMVLPHPEEPRMKLEIGETVDLGHIRNLWLHDWGVPIEYHAFWKAWPIILVPNLTYMGKTYPALTWPDQIEIDPTWCNPGVIAHELCHVLWDEFPDDKRVTFSAAYQIALKDHLLLKFAYWQKPYMQMTLGQNHDREGHAEMYRYLGTQMPNPLKGYYTKLI